MPTQIRKWYPGASYHVTARGNHREDIFRDNEDFAYYLTLIKETVKYYFNEKYEIISYCFMDNHVHLLIKTGEKPLGEFIGRINSKYAKYYNEKYDCVGHLFQDRYFSELIESDAQMIETSRYIHLNPVRAKMTEKPESYKWSSYSMYIGNQREYLISSGLVLSFFSDRDSYRKYVEAGIAPGV